jgi:hypothetical protein
MGIELRDTRFAEQDAQAALLDLAEFRKPARGRRKARFGCSATEN